MRGTDANEESRQGTREGQRRLTKRSIRAASMGGRAPHWQGGNARAAQRLGCSGVRVAGAAIFPTKSSDFCVGAGAALPGRVRFLALAGGRFEVHGPGGEGDFRTVGADDFGDLQQHVLLHLVVVHPLDGPGEGVDEEI